MPDCRRAGQRDDVDAVTDGRLELLSKVGGGDRAIRLEDVDSRPMLAQLLRQQVTTAGSSRNQDARPSDQGGGQRRGELLRLKKRRDDLGGPAVVRERRRRLRADGGDTYPAWQGAVTKQLEEPVDAIHAGEKDPVVDIRIRECHLDGFDPEQWADNNHRTHGFKRPNERFRLRRRPGHHYADAVESPRTTVGQEPAGTSSS